MKFNLWQLIHHIEKKNIRTSVFHSEKDHMVVVDIHGNIHMIGPIHPREVFEVKVSSQIQKNKNDIFPYPIQPNHTSDGFEFCGDDVVFVIRLKDGKGNYKYLSTSRYDVFIEDPDDWNQLRVFPHTQDGRRRASEYARTRNLPKNIQIVNYRT